MKKRTKLVIAGVIAFLVVVSYFTAPILIKKPTFVDDAEYISIKPYFIEQYLKVNSNYKPKQIEKISSRDIVLESVTLSKDGFSKKLFIIEKPISLRISNDGESSRTVVITSPSMEGAPYMLSQLSIPANKDIVLGILIPPYIKEIIESPDVKIEKTDKGFLIFEISCVSNCKETNNYLQIYVNFSDNTAKS
jgi:hypothetical protein